LNDLLPYSSKELIPDYYIKELNGMWNNWLKEKYKTPQNTIKTWGLDRLNPTEKILVRGDEGWRIEKRGGADCEKTTRDGATILTIRNVTSTNWHLQYCRTHLNLSKNKNYLFRFNGSADRELKIVVVAQRMDRPGEDLELAREIILNQQPQTYQIPFAVIENCSNVKVGFVIGGAEGRIVLKDIELKEIETLCFIAEEKNLAEFKFQRPLCSLLLFYPQKQKEDIKEFYVGLGKIYFDELMNYLKREVGVKIPITGIGGYSDSEDMETQTPCDFIDTHTYWDHPYFTNKLWDKNDFKIQNRSMLLDKDLGIIKTILRHAPQPKTKPYTVTEWNHCYPNQYAYETPVLIASEATKNNWDGLFIFAFKHFIPYRYNIGIDSYFDIVNNPQKLILCSLGSFIFNNNYKIDTAIENGVYRISSSEFKGVVGFIKDKTYYFDSFSIKADQNGGVFLFSPENKPIQESNRLMLVTIGEVKNKDSSWDNGEKYDWGYAPTLLKKIGVEISLNINNNFKVYEIDDRGVRSRPIETNLDSSGVISFSTHESKTIWFEIIADLNYKNSS
jgi:hypothetical protein